MSIYILTPELFIKQKSPQLVYVTNKLLNSAMPYAEAHIMMWDILEEWGKLSTHNQEQPNDFERVFWYLFFVIQFESQSDLINNKHLRLTINKCCNYLIDPTLALPKGCVGVRP